MVNKHAFLFLEHAPSCTIHISKWTCGAFKPSHLEQKIAKCWVATTCIFQLPSGSRIGKFFAKTSTQNGRDGCQSVSVYPKNCYISNSCNIPHDMKCLPSLNLTALHQKKKLKIRKIWKISSSKARLFFLGHGACWLLLGSHPLQA